MSNDERSSVAGKESPVVGQEDDESPEQGPNLVVIYGLVALALAVAIGFALMIVLPFYRRR